MIQVTNKGRMWWLIKDKKQVVGFASTYEKALFKALELEKELKTITSRKTKLSKPTIRGRKADMVIFDEAETLNLVFGNSEGIRKK